MFFEALHNFPWPTGETLASWFLIYIAYAFLGFLAQNWYMKIQRLCHVKCCPTKTFFRFLPLSPLFGFGALAVLALKEIILLPQDGPFYVFLLGFAGGTVIELVVGEFFKWFTGENYLWNYKFSFIQFDEQICLESSILFGLAAISVVYLGQPLMEQLFFRPNLQGPALIMLLIFLAEICFTLYERRNFFLRRFLSWKDALLSSK